MTTCKPFSHHPVVSSIQPHYKNNGYLYSIFLPLPLSCFSSCDRHLSNNITKHLGHINLTNTKSTCLKTCSHEYRSATVTFNTPNGSQANPGLVAVLLCSDKHSCLVIPTLAHLHLHVVTSITSTSLCACHDLCTCEVLPYLILQTHADWLLASLTEQTLGCAHC